MTPMKDDTSRSIFLLDVMARVMNEVGQRIWSASVACIFSPDTHLGKKGHAGVRRRDEDTHLRVTSAQVCTHTQHTHTHFLEHTSRVSLSFSNACVLEMYRWELQCHVMHYIFHQFTAPLNKTNMMLQLSACVVLKHHGRDYGAGNWVKVYMFYLYQGLLIKISTE